MKLQLIRLGLSRESFQSPRTVLQLARSYFWHLCKRVGLTSHWETMEDQAKDRILPFDEHPSCEMCGSDVTREKLITRDGSRIVECCECGLWFTSPRIREERWIEYLKSDTERNQEFTENRLGYGDALGAGTKYARPNWRRYLSEINLRLLEGLEKRLGRKIQRLHDVGCGVGFLLADAESIGIKASGNELNEYACRVMKTRLGLDVHHDVLSNVNIEPGSLDVVVMTDYIEHTYHPLADLRVACALLKPGGLVFVRTFHIGCRAFDAHREDWHMLFWNHVYHFSERTLTAMIEAAGFRAVSVETGQDSSLISVTALKG